MLVTCLLENPLARTDLPCGRSRVEVTRILYKEKSASKCCRRYRISLRLKRHWLRLEGFRPLAFPLRETTVVDYRNEPPLASMYAFTSCGTVQQGFHPFASRLAAHTL